MAVSRVVGRVVLEEVSVGAEPLSALEDGDQLAAAGEHVGDP